MTLSKKELLDEIQKLLTDHNYFTPDAKFSETELLQHTLAALKHHLALIDKSAQLTNHTIQVYLSLAARGAYPPEITPGAQHFLGIPGFVTHQQILKQLELTRKKQAVNEQRDSIQS